MKDNIIQFPLEKRMMAIADEEYEKVMEEEYATEQYGLDCVDTSQLILMMIEELINEQDGSPFEGMDFRNKDFPEAQDAFVIVNLLSSMFMRYGGMKHFLQEYLDIIFMKIQAQQDLNDFT